MTRIIDTPKALLVEVPEGATHFYISKIHSELWFKVNGATVKGHKIPPEGKYELYGQPILAEEMTFDDWGKIISQYSSMQSGEYFLRSHNLKPETTVVIPKI